MVTRNGRKVVLFDQGMALVLALAGIGALLGVVWGWLTYEEQQ